MDHENLLKRYFDYVADREGPYFAPDESEGFSAEEVDYLDGLLRDWSRRRRKASNAMTMEQYASAVLRTYLGPFTQNNAFLRSLQKRR